MYSLNFVLCFLFVRYDLTQFKVVSDNPKVESFSRSSVWEILSKALDRSKLTTAANLPESVSL